MKTSDVIAPVVSVIVPVFNVEDYIEECVDSILAQSYKNWEMILVDDGSTDSCPEICDRYGAQDSRIIAVHKANGGLSSARNVGLDMAKGDLVTFIDSDDVMLGPDTMARIVNEFTCDPEVDVVQYDVLFKYKSSEEHKRIYPFAIYRGAESILMAYLDQNIHVSCCDKFFRREIFDTLRFPTGQICEDIAIIPDISSRIHKLNATDIGYYGYRYRDGSISQSSIPYNKICLILDSYHRFVSAAMDYPALRPKALAMYAEQMWAYLSVIRTQNPDCLADFIQRDLFFKISLREWLRYVHGYSRMDMVRTFALCVSGIRSAIRLQNIFTR